MAVIDFFRQPILIINTVNAISDFVLPFLIEVENYDFSSVRPIFMWTT